MWTDGLGLADLLGILGFLVYACADTLLALRRLHSDQIRFYVIYAAAGILILLSLSLDFNLGAFLTEVFTLMTCCVAIGLRLFGPAARAFMPTPPRDLRALPRSRRDQPADWRGSPAKTL